MMIDTHCHISKKDYENINEVISHMKDNIMIISGADPIDLDEVIEITNKYDNVYCTIGIHPEFADTYTTEDINKIIENLSNPKVVGIGEIGLDYYWRKDNKDKQRELFIKQIEIANKYNKPIVIHSRESIEDTYNILKEYAKTKIDIHCFSSSIEMAKKFIEIGAKLGIGGVLTFKNSIKLKEIVKEIPIEYLMLETDSPYLTPEPFRGHKNEPYNIYYVAEHIANIKKIKLEEVLEKTTSNAISQFDLDVPLC